MNPTCTIPSFSGTFGITHETIFFKGVREYFIFPTRFALNPKMPKEPSSPSRSNTQTETQCVKNETDRSRNNKGQRTIN
ncbi:MAG: hypothetical protein Q8J88_17635 [Bacteroidales bacterium]|nr:hypothetical protein [Bacteroidales bacterium]